MNKAKPNTTLKSRATGARKPANTSTGGAKPKAPTKAQSDHIKMEHTAQATNGIDINELAEVLAQRLGLGQVAGVTITGASSDSVIGAMLGSTGSGSNRASSPGGISVGTSLQPKNPIENEVANLAAQIEEVQNLINGLNLSLDPLLAHVQVADESEAEVNPSRSSESPHHRRLIDLSDGLSNVIIRMRYLQSRVRT